MTLFDARDSANAEEVQAAIASLRAEYETRGLELVDVASRFRIQIRASVGAAGVAFVAGAANKVLARAARDAGAGGVPAAHHPW